VDSTQKPSNARIIWIVVFAAVAIVVAIIAAVIFMVLGIFKLVDNAGAHRCGLAIVQHDPAAIRMLGEPIQQKGFTGGSTNTTNGKTTEDLTFTVAGPLGEATVEAIGVKSQLESRLDVRMGRNGQSTTIYSGPFDCPALHEGSTQ
jgi:Cytochrome oxidase complex assembly protein 1